MVIDHGLLLIIEDNVRLRKNSGVAVCVWSWIQLSTDFPIASYSNIISTESIVSRLDKGEGKDSVYFILAANQLLVVILGCLER